METIEIQCGSCNQMMGVLAEHLGTQVHCPHCEAIVQTPPPETMAAEPHSGVETPEHGESIFAEPEKDDILDSEIEQPKIHIPDRASEFASAGFASAGEDAVAESSTASSRLPDLSLEKRRDDGAASGSSGSAIPRTGKRNDPFDAAPSSGTDLGFHGESQAVTQAVKPRRRSVLIPSLLIFLVPYSIVATIFVVFLLMNRGANVAEDPMQRIPDPEPSPKSKKGPPRKITRVQHDSPLPEHLVTTLKKSVRVGDIEVTPLEVRQTAAGNLALRFKARNLALNHAFVPVSPSFLKVSEQTEVAKPYTFLHDRELTRRIYGGFLEFQTRDGELDLNSDGELLPGQEQMIQISTLDRFNSTAGSLVRGGGRCLWRIQVRRGLVDVAGHPEPLSATAIIGVEFAPNEVIRERGRS